MLEVNKWTRLNTQGCHLAMQSESLGSLLSLLVVCEVGIPALWPSKTFKSTSRTSCKRSRSQGKGPACKGPCIWQSGPSLPENRNVNHGVPTMNLRPRFALASLGHAHMLLPLARITNLGPPKISPTACNFLFKKHIQQNWRQNMTECHNPHLASTFLVLYWLKAPQVTAHISMIQIRSLVCDSKLNQILQYVMNPAVFNRTSSKLSRKSW